MTIPPRINLHEDAIACRARELLELFPTSRFRHGAANEHAIWLGTVGHLPVSAAVQFFNSWRPLSRHQPQLLLLLASAFPGHAEQKAIIEGNAREEGGWKEGHDPHWVLLDNLIRNIGGTPNSAERSEELMIEFQDSLRRPMEEAEAAAVLAGIENPALEISSYFRDVVRLTGFEPLLDEDPYLTIHVRVEPGHIVDSHELALHYMNRGTREREIVLAAFDKVMQFWSEFWATAFEQLKRSIGAASTGD